MPSTHESNDIRKAMAYDLMDILHSAEMQEKQTLTIPEVEELIRKYITVATSNN